MYKDVLSITHLIRISAGVNTKTYFQIFSSIDMGRHLKGG